jgi:hypothetical protein
MRLPELEQFVIESRELQTKHIRDLRSQVSCLADVARKLIDRPGIPDELKADMMKSLCAVDA